MKEYVYDTLIKGISATDLDFAYIQFEVYGYEKGDPIDLGDITTDILMFMDSVNDAEQNVKQLRIDLEENAELLAELKEYEDDLKYHLRMVEILSKMYNNAMISDGSDSTVEKFINENRKGQ